MDSQEESIEVPAVLFAQVFDYLRDRQEAAEAAVIKEGEDYDADYDIKTISNTIRMVISDERGRITELMYNELGVLEKLYKAHKIANKLAESKMVLAGIIVLEAMIARIESGAVLEGGMYSEDEKDFRKKHGK